MRTPTDAMGIFCCTHTGAPTGSGKTVLFELAILHALRGKHATSVAARSNTGRRKVIYLAPLRSLVSEKFRDWSHRLGRIGLTFAELTGDRDYGADIWREMENVDIILATPEKFDRVTRLDANRGGMSFFADVCCVLIDEVHLIGDSRGGCLEAIVSRLKLLSKSSLLANSYLRSVRFGAVSATIPNTKNIADWLGCSRAGLWIFGEEFRPVKLQTYVRTFRDGSNDFMFNKFLKDHVYGVVVDFYCGKQTLVFCASRDNALQVTKALVAQSNVNGKIFVDQRHAMTLREASNRAKNKSLAECILGGCAFHHAGLEKEDRELVESLFHDRIITVLCSTSTLAIGVNLPAYLCVICGTDVYDGNGSYKEISMDSLVQMIGRAGRPQFDSEGVAVVMTKNSLRQRYEGLVHGKSPLESSLGAALPEYLNAEISCRTVNSKADAHEWLKSTFYFIRMWADPKRYGLKPNETIDAAVKRIVDTTLDALTSAGMCALNENDALLPRRAGDIMSLRYLRFETMKGIMRAIKTPQFSDLLMMMCSSDELKGIKLRRDERKSLKTLNLDGESGLIRYPLREATGKTKKLTVSKVIRTSSEKLYLVAQYMLTDVLEPKLTILPSMRIEGDKVFHIGVRILKAASEYFQSTATFSAATNAFALAKSLDQGVHMWPDSKIHISQLKHARGKKTIGKLLDSKISTLSDVERADPRRIEMVLGKDFPFGNNLQSDVKDLPSALRIEMSHECVGVSSWNIDVKIFFKDARDNRMSHNHLPSKYPGTIFVGSEHDDCLLFVGHLPVKEVDFNTDVSATGKYDDVIFHARIHCSSAPTGTLPLCLMACIIFERCIGRDMQLTYFIERGGGSPRTPSKKVRSNIVSPTAKTPQFSASPSWKQTTLDSHTKRFKLSQDDGNIRRQMTFDDFKMPEEDLVGLLRAESPRIVRSALVPDANLADSDADSDAENWNFVFQ